MRWHFPVPAGSRVAVRLYFAEHCACARKPGERVFDVRVDGKPRLKRYDVVKAAGWRRGTSRLMRLESDGRVDLTFVRRVGRPLVNAIEVTRLTPPEGGAVLQQVAYDGTDPGQAGIVPTDVSWGRARGGVVLGSTLYTGWANGRLYARSLDAQGAVGKARRISLHGLTRLSRELRQVTGLFYDKSRLYYTLRGQEELYYRYFTAESEVVGAERFVAATSEPGLHWRNAAGMFLSGDQLYVASGVDGSLVRVGWRGGTVAGSPEVVSTPRRDGVSWASRALFLVPAG